MYTEIKRQMINIVNSNDINVENEPEREGGGGREIGNGLSLQTDMI